MYGHPTDLQNNILLHSILQSKFHSESTMALFYFPNLYWRRLTKPIHFGLLTIIGFMCWTLNLREIKWLICSSFIIIFLEHDLSTNILCSKHNVILCLHNSLSTINSFLHLMFSVFEHSLMTPTVERWSNKIFDQWDRLK